MNAKQIEAARSKAEGCLRRASREIGNLRDVAPHNRGDWMEGLIDIAADVDKARQQIDIARGLLGL